MPLFHLATRTNFRPKEPVSMGAQLHRILRKAIVEGDLRPGQALSETEMSKQFSISRQPVREAFIKLGEERLIEVLPQRGSYVRKISVKEVLDARHLREIIEVSIVRDVTHLHDDTLIGELRRIIAQQQGCVHGDNRAFHELDEEFHKSIALHAGREYAWRVTEGIKAQMNRVRFLALDFATPTDQLIAEHGAIVDAIEAGDAELAVSRMEEHLRRLITSLPLIARKYPEHFAEE